MVNPDMKAELNVSVKGGNFELNNKYLADMNVREAANIVFSMKQSICRLASGYARRFRQGHIPFWISPPTRRARQGGAW